LDGARGSFRNSGLLFSGRDAQADGPVKTGKSGQKEAKIDKIPIKTKENCGNRGFSIDIGPPKVAL
jgi:hypothetical protein